MDVSNPGVAGNVNLVPVGKVLSHGTVYDEDETFDYEVKFVGGASEYRLETNNNSFTVHPDGSADFYSAFTSKNGTGSNGGAFADNVSAAIRINFFEEGSYVPAAGGGIPSDAILALVSINHQPSEAGGVSFPILHSHEYFDIDWDGGDNWIEVFFDAGAQLYVDSPLGSTTLNTYDTNVTGATSLTDPGTGGFTEPSSGVFRLEFNVRHSPDAADWRVNLGASDSFLISRSGYPGIRSGLGFNAVPEPGSNSLVLLASLTLLCRKRR